MKIFATRKSTYGYDTEASGEYARITGIVFDKICTLGEEFEAARKQKKEKKK